MSLDVYRKLPGARIARHGYGIFIRESGQTLEITREQWNARFPRREPVTCQRDNETDSDAPPLPFWSLPVIDNPELDGTDAAHPAWCRGQQAGFDAAMRLIEQALTERPAGVIGNARWQALRERIYDMARR